MAEREHDDELENDVIGRADDEDEEFGDEEETDEEDDEDAVVDEGDEDVVDEEATGEVGDEGGSPGDRVGVSRTRTGPRRGSEATESVRRERSGNIPIDRTDEAGRPQRRNP